MLSLAELVSVPAGPLLRSSTVSLSLLLKLLRVAKAARSIRLQAHRVNHATGNFALSLRPGCNFLGVSHGGLGDSAPSHESSIGRPALRL